MAIYQVARLLLLLLRETKGNEEIRTISTSEIGPILRTMMSTSTVAGGPPKSGLTLLS